MVFRVLRKRLILGYATKGINKLFLDPIGYGNELKYGYLVKGGVRKTPA